MKDLAGKVAVVTGAGSGIGAGIAAAFAEAGMKVAVVDVDAARAADVARGLTGALGFGADVTDFAAMKALADGIGQACGSVDVLCNNAGVMLSGPWANMTPADWRWTFEVNVFGVVNGIYAFLPAMLERGAGHIVNTASMASFGGGANHSAYTASKHACTVITESLRGELAGTGVGVSGLYPGGVMTDIMNSQRSRPAHFGKATRFMLGDVEVGAEGADLQAQAAMARMAADIMDPAEVGRIVRQAVIDDEPWIFTHPHWLRPDRWDEIAAAAARARARMAVGG